MTLYRARFPILEYDDQQGSVLMPDHEGLDLHLPKKCVFAFLDEAVDKFAREHEAKVVSHFISSTKTYPIYLIEEKGEAYSLVQAPVGSAPAAQLLDWLIGYGAREIVSTGSCGVLIDLPENEWLVPCLALRDEGASYHYLPPTRTIKVNRQVREVIREVLYSHQLNYQEVMTWSTDGFYRETADLVRYRKAEGCQVVEMECAALAAVAQFRKVLWGQILFTADSLAAIDSYESRNFGVDSHAYALQLCVEAVKKL